MERRKKGWWAQWKVKQLVNRMKGREGGGLPHHPPPLCEIKSILVFRFACQREARDVLGVVGLPGKLKVIQGHDRSCMLMVFITNFAKSQL